MKKNPHSTLERSPGNLNLEDTFEEHPITDWIVLHGKTFLYALGVGFVLLFIASFWFSRGTSEATTDYYNASREFQLFDKQSLSGTEGTSAKPYFDKLNAILHKYPDLHAKYDGQIAQIFLDRNEVSQAKPFAEATLKRTSQDHLIPYAEYSKISLLIAENNIVEALARSIALKQTLATKESSLETENSSLTPPPENLLYAFNLLRIPFLQQIAGSPTDELHSWQEWLQYNTAENLKLMVAPEAIENIAKIFSNDDLSLAQYIEARMKKLSVR